MCKTRCFSLFLGFIVALPALAENNLPAPVEPVKRDQQISQCIAHEKQYYNPYLKHDERRVVKRLVNEHCQISNTQPDGTGMLCVFDKPHWKTMGRMYYVIDQALERGDYTLDGDDQHLLINGERFEHPLNIGQCRGFTSPPLTK